MKVTIPGVSVIINLSTLTLRAQFIQQRHHRSNAFSLNSVPAFCAKHKFPSHTLKYLHSGSMWDQEIHEHVMRRDEEEYELQTKAEDNPKETQRMRQNLKRCNVHAVSCGKIQSTASTWMERSWWSKC